MPRLMRTSAKIFLDHVVGMPLTLAANAVARLLGFLLRRRHDLNQSEIREIAVAKFAGMGSMIEAIPLLRALKARFPQARISFVTSMGCRALVERMPYMDGGFYVDDRGLWRLGVSFVKTLAALNRRPPDLYFDLEVYSRFASLMAIGSRAMNRYGFYRHTTWFKGGLYTYLVFFNARYPIRQIYLQMGRAVGVPAEASDLLEPIRVRQEDRDRLAARNLLPPAGEGGPALVVINPNASDLLLERRWPAELFAELIEKLAAAGRRVVMIGSPSEAAHVARVLSLVDPTVRPGVINTAGQLNLAELFALLERADVVITNDTGPMHMAVSLGRRTVCLFGPVSPGHYGFREPNVAVLNHPVYCSPCVHEIEQPPCQGENECMRLIRPEVVLAAVDQLLKGGGAGPATAVSSVAGLPGRGNDPVFVRQRDEVPLGIVMRDSMQNSIRTPCPCCDGQWWDALFRLKDHPVIRCRKCGLERLSPQPGDRELGAIYRQEYYDSWGAKLDPEISRNLKQQTFARRLAALSGLKPGDRVLDCGAALGHFMEVAKQAGFEPYGIERSEFGAAQIAKTFGAERVFAGPFEEAAFAGLPDGGFQAVSMFDFVEHVRDPEAVLRKAFELLAPGGQLILSTPRAGSLTHRLMKQRWSHYKVEHLYYFRKGNLTRLLERVGFREVRSASSRKALNLEYVAFQFQAYPHRLLTPLSRLGRRCLPQALRQMAVRVPLGEMVLIARKP